MQIHDELDDEYDDQNMQGLKAEVLQTRIDSSRMITAQKYLATQKAMKELVSMSSVKALMVRLRGSMTVALNIALGNVPQRAEGLSASEIAAILTESKAEFEEVLSAELEKHIKKITSERKQPS